jgi:MFS family permease
VREPSRTRAGRSDAAPSFPTTLRFVWSQHSLRHLIAAITLTTITMNGIGIWSFSYFVRIHHVDLGQIGPVLGFAYPISAIIGTFAGGDIADRLAKRDIRWRAWVPALGALTCVPVTAALVLARDWPTTLILWAAYGLTAPIWSGPGYGLSLSLVASRMRATQTAIVFLLTNAVGFGLAPMIVGALSDTLAPRFGGQSLRYAMLAIGLVNLWATLHFALAGRRLASDLVRASDADDSAAGARL